LTVTATGTYSVVVTAPNSCTATDAVVVTVNALPVVNLGADVSQCGGTATLDAGNAGSTYAWSNAATTQTTIVSTSGTYSVVVTTGAGCKGSDTVVVTIKALPTVSFTLSTDTTCVNGGLIALSGTPAGGTFSGTGVSGTNFSPATSGAGTFTITYSVTDATTNCSASASDVIVVKSICAGIENIATIAATIYPTPTTGTINIKGIETNKSSIEAKVYDMQGKVVMINTIAATNANYQMNVSELAAGVYTISITTEKGNYIGRFVRE
jgi:hypothetical protein